jgi:hypothetical protein
VKSLRQNSGGGRYLIRGFFATTLGIIWLISSREILTLSPALFIAFFSMIFGIEILGISILRERARRSPV